MNILFLNAYFAPEQIAFTHLENDLINGLIEKGHEIFVLCPSPTRGIEPDVVKKYKRIKYEDMYDGKVHVRRFYAPQENRNIILRAIRYFLCNYQTIRLGKKYKNIDAVFAVSTPPTQGAVATIVAKKIRKKSGKKIPVIYSLQDIFPDSLKNANITKENSFIWKIGRCLEDYTYRNVDEIITISESFKDNIVKKGVPEEKITVVPNWINTDNVFPVERKNNPLFDKYKLDRNKFYICYSGNIGHSQNMDLLLDVAKELQESNRDICFVIIGDGAAKIDVENRIKNENIDNVIMFPYQPYEDIANVFSLGDAGLIVSKAGIGESSVPSKTWSIMASQRPIVASFDKKSDLIKLIERIECGYVAQADDIEGLVNIIKKAYYNRTLNEKLAINGKRYISEIVSKHICVKRYIDVMNKYL